MDLQCTIAGPTLAALMFEMSSSSQDMEGFLFGTVAQQKVRTQEDSSESEKYLVNLAIQSFFCSPSTFSFYDSLGEVNMPRVQETIAEKTKSQSLLGWFKFRRNSSLRPSLRESYVHSQLHGFHERTQTKEGGGGVPLVTVPLIMGLFTWRSSGESSVDIHTHDYRFLQISPRGVIQPLALGITNLVNSSQIEYNEFVPLSPFTTTASESQPPSLFSEMISSFSKEGLTELVGKTPPLYIEELERFYHLSLKKLTTLANQVHESTAEIRQLEEELVQLKGIEEDQNNRRRNA